MTTPNYTAAQVKVLQDADTIDLQGAKQFAKTWNKSTKSVIAKAVSLGVYQAQVKAKRSAPKILKADVVASIAKATKASNLRGLEKAPMSALENLLKALA
jgi:hypothetical protein